ncbi:PREDICTED: protein CYR61 [Haliaeetus leucocephalus]|nr:PREDICTED: protein CYR61 [Haliaeetus leucocephalus]
MPVRIREHPDPCTALPRVTQHSNRGTENEGKHVLVTTEFAVAGSSRTAVQPRHSVEHTITVPVKPTILPPTLGGCHRGEEPRRCRLPACAPGSSRQQRRPSARRTKGRGLGCPGGGKALEGPKSSPRHLWGGYPEDRARLQRKLEQERFRLGSEFLPELSSDLIFSLYLGFPHALGSPCPAVCQCPAAAPQCAPGVGLVPDGCGCCKVCAKQLNEDCSRAQPCDHTKGLECNFGASPAALKGICRAQSEGRPCEYNSKIYQNGESFQPNCKHQCTCIDGAVGCIPLCPQELSLPNLGCPSPRLVKVPGQCCEEWVCDESKDALDELEGFFSKEFGLDDSEGELTRNNELIAIVKGGLKMLPVFGSEPQSRAFENPKCIVQTTSWSQCSKTCGTGISTRVTNDNPDCKLIKETRICEVRPCGQPSYASLKKGKKCTKTKKSPSPVKFTYAGCSSVKKYRPKYCGSCVDGRCCTPQQTRTVKIRFRCDDGETFTKSVMMIQSCRCNYNCPHANEAYPYYRLVNDIHKFRD